jgi:hypothetical protein
MIRLEFTPDEARRLRELLVGRLRALSTEINRTEQRDFKASLRKTARLLERIVQELEAADQTT